MEEVGISLPHDRHQAVLMHMNAIIEFIEFAFPPPTPSPFLFHLASAATEPSLKETAASSVLGGLPRVLASSPRLSVVHKVDTNYRQYS